MPFEAMSLSMAVWCVGSPPCGNRNGANLGEEIAEGDHLIAMRARSTGAKATAKNTTLVAALLAKEPGIALGVNGRSNVASGGLL